MFEILPLLHCFSPYIRQTILGQLGVIITALLTMRGIQAVEQDKIDAMISDGILLRAEAQQQGLSSTEYPLTPNITLTCDRYGMIIPGNDPEWQDFVNSVINSPEAAALSTAWFGKLFRYTQLSQDICP